MRLEEIYQICKRNQYILLSYTKNIAGYNENQKSISKTKYDRYKNIFYAVKEAIIDFSHIWS